MTKILILLIELALGVHFISICFLYEVFYYMWLIEKE
jgi:hypothetical protein